MTTGRYADFAPDLSPIEATLALIAPGVSVSGAPVGGTQNVYSIEFAAANGAATFEILFGPNGQPFDHEISFSGSVSIDSIGVDIAGI